MKNLLFLCCFVGLTLPSFAQDFEWVRGMGGTFFDNDKGIALDQSGNIYTTGSFEQTADFDPSSSTFSLTSAGDEDVFIQKMDANGNFLWAVSFGSTQRDASESIAVDASGNVYVTGSFQGTVDFDPGSGISNLTSNGIWDIFILKLDSSGSFLWAKSFGSSVLDEGTAIAVNNKGDVYAAGLFSNTVDFDPGSGVFNMTANSILDIYLLKLGSNGNFLWAKRLPRTVANNYVYELAVDKNDNLYSVGYFQGVLDADPNAGVFNLTSNGNEDIFIHKLAANGNFLWATSIGSTAKDRGHGITVDKEGNVYSTGGFKGTMDADPSTNTLPLISNGDDDVFIQKLDPTGHLLWATSLGGSKLDNGWGITTDTLGNVYTSGGYQGTVDFDPGVGIANLTANSGGTDAYIQKLDKNGDFLWATSTGKSGTFDYAFDVQVDQQGNVYASGVYSAGTDFDPSPAVVTIPTNGVTDVYVLKLSQPGGVITITTLDEQTIQLYPNPSTGKVMIELATNQSTAITVLDVQGKAALAPIKSEQAATALDLSSLPTGVYYISVATATSNSVVKWVKM